MATVILRQQLIRKPDLADRRELMSTPLVLVLVMKQIDQLLHKTLHSLHIV